MKITPARSASDGGEIVKIGLVRQPQPVEISNRKNYSVLTSER